MKRLTILIPELIESLILDQLHRLQASGVEVLPDNAVGRPITTGPWEEAETAVFTPWSDGYLTGFKCIVDGVETLVYFNPSTGGDCPDLFIYTGVGDPVADRAISFVDLKVQPCQKCGSRQYANHLSRKGLCNNCEYCVTNEEILRLSRDDRGMATQVGLWLDEKLCQNDLSSIYAFLVDVDVNLLSPQSITFIVITLAGSEVTEGVQAAFWLRCRDALLQQGWDEQRILRLEKRRHGLTGDLLLRGE